MPFFYGGVMSETTTRGIRIKVESEFLSEESAPDENEYVFAYCVRILNESDQAVRLLGRHWIITNGDGVMQEVCGEGVVGEQPRLEPGEYYEYTSLCPLATPVGTMHGSYRMVTEFGEQFDAKISPFSLRSLSASYH